MILLPASLFAWQRGDRMIVIGHVHPILIGEIIQLYTFYVLLLQVHVVPEGAICRQEAFYGK